MMSQQLLNLVPMDKRALKKTVLAMNPLRVLPECPNTKPVEPETRSRRSSGEYQINNEDITPAGYYDYRDATKVPQFTRTDSGRMVRFREPSDDMSTLNEKLSETRYILDASLPASFKI